MICDLSSPEYTRFTAYLLNRCSYAVAADAFQRQHVQLKASNVRHFKTDFILNCEADGVEQMEREQKGGKIACPPFPQRADEGSFRRRLKNELRTGSVKVRFQQRFPSELAFGLAD